MTLPGDEELEMPLADLANRLGPRGARDRLLQWLGGPGLRQPERLLDIVREARELLAEVDQTTRETVWNVTIAAIAKTGPDLGPDDSDLQAKASRLRAGLHSGRYTVDGFAAGLVGLALDGATTDRERQGFAFLEEAADLGAPLLEPHGRALGWLRAVLLVGNAVNAVNAKAYGEAFDWYAQAITVELALDLYDKVLHQLRGLLNIVKRSPDSLTNRVVGGLAPRVLWIESSPGALGARGEELLQDIFRAAVGQHIAHGQGTLEELVALLQCFKARRFDTLVRTGIVRVPQPDQYGRQLLQKVATAERELPPEDRILAPPDSEQALDEDTLLSAYARIREEGAPGQTATERLNNLQHAFEADFQQRILTTIHSDILNAPPPRSGATLQSQLGSRTVLVQQALARTPDGFWGIATLLMTQEGAVAGGVYTNVPDGLTVLTEDGRTARMHHVGGNVAGLRRELREGWTPHEAASDQVRQSLNVHSYFGHMTDALKLLHEQGKDHLCIVPHGPLHFLPYHLLELDGRPLADDWIVTYMPSVGLLLRASGPSAGRTSGPSAGRERRSDEVAVFGVGFGSEYPFGLPELPESVAEAESVASVYHMRPKLDRDATPKSVCHALEHARVVHLSTHGRHNVIAPGFQTLYLWPADGSDGRLRAYEIATLDLAGIDVITLSACETALGRFDFSDNLRGLPATLLLGGVSAIVSTLWNVEPVVSLAFFKEFHAQVAANGKHRLLEAFSAAQRAARAIDNHYLEWGAFYLTGGRFQ